MHHFVGADSSCISWGVAQSGELGYGPLGQKYVSSFYCKPVDIFNLLHFKFMSLYIYDGVLFSRSSAMAKKVDSLEGMHVMRLVIGIVEK